MIEIRLTGSRNELNQAMSVTRSGYKILAKTKPQQLPTDPQRWTIHIRAEFKAIGVEVPPSLSTATLTGHDAPQSAPSIAESHV